MILTENYIKLLNRNVYDYVDICLEHFSNLDLEKDESFWNQYDELNPYIMSQEKPNLLYYHVYWYGKFTEKQELCVKSYLATQKY